MANRKPRIVITDEDGTFTKELYIKCGEYVSRTKKLITTNEMAGILLAEALGLEVELDGDESPAPPKRLTKAPTPKVEESDPDVEENEGEEEEESPAPRRRGRRASS